MSECNLRQKTGGILILRTSQIGLQRDFTIEEWRDRLLYLSSVDYYAYSAYVLSILIYSCEPLVNGSKKIIDSLENFHNQALHFINGVVKSIPIDYMLLCTNSSPRTLIIKERVADFISHFEVEFGAQQFLLPRNLIEAKTFTIRLGLSQSVLKVEDNDKVVK
ncbi:hypothetical protein CEXT_337251 [Caerostris extrusa]|uniref:Uncharacterized protein n=1 Tax=Caerostris extrusa TaxID=172846 RepID=A0AAV4NG92_CAEEX|nr:hypothetical protein CEXT_337251 [Caerostris extrusa]